VLVLEHRENVAVLFTTAPVGPLDPLAERRLVRQLLLQDVRRGVDDVRLVEGTRIPSVSWSTFRYWQVSWGVFLPVTARGRELLAERSEFMHFVGRAVALDADGQPNPSPRRS